MIQEELTNLVDTHVKDQSHEPGTSEDRRKARVLVAGGVTLVGQHSAWSGPGSRQTDMWRPWKLPLGLGSLSEKDGKQLIKYGFLRHKKGQALCDVCRNSGECSSE